MELGMLLEKSKTFEDIENEAELAYIKSLSSNLNHSNDENNKHNNEHNNEHNKENNNDFFTESLIHKYTNNDILGNNDSNEVLKDIKIAMDYDELSQYISEGMLLFMFY